MSWRGSPTGVISKQLVGGQHYHDGVLRLYITGPAGTEDVWGEEFAIFGSEPVQDLTGDNLKRGLEALKRMDGEVRDFHKIGGDPFQLVSQGAYWFQREYAREWPAEDYPGWAEYLERTRNEADAR